MSPAAKKRFRRLAHDRARAKWGQGWAMLSEDMQADLLVAEAAYLVMAQDVPKYAPARELLEAVVS